MEYQISHDQSHQSPSACVAVGIHPDRKLSPSAANIDKAAGGLLTRLLERGDLEGKKGETLVLHQVPGVRAERVLLIGCGKSDELNEGHYRDIAAKAVKAALATGAVEVTLYLAELAVAGRDLNWKIRHAAEAGGDSLYRFDRLKSKKTDPRPLARIAVAVPAGADTGAASTALAQGRAIGLGLTLTKDLGNLPGNICTPSYLADQARELGNQYGIKTTILEKADMEKLGMGSLLSVARGSRQPPKLIVLEYRGGPESQAPVALVGKGLTFDAGGISLKPPANMDEMKYDMCGGATVLGVLKAIAELKLPINVVGVIPSSENLPDGDANKPGDVVTSMSGQTIEILNTDAEGRLILCDALTYTERFKPAAVIDIATLTGACIVALGHHASGLLGNDEALTAELLEAGRDAHDRAWQLPLWDEFQKQLDSNFADMANVGGKGGGTITGACFLARYTKAYKWAHLDIAGTAWKSGKDKGATGRPVGMLTSFLIARAARGA